MRSTGMSTASSTHWRWLMWRRVLALLAAAWLLANCSVTAQETQQCSLSASSGDAECSAPESNAPQQATVLADVETEHDRGMVDSKALDAVEQELQNLEELIALQQRKAQLLREARRRIMMGERLSTVAASTLTSDQSDLVERAHGLHSGLSRRMALHSDAAIAWSAALPFKTRARNQQLTMLPLYGLISEDGSIAIRDPFGEAIFAQSLAHDAPIACAKFDGSDALNPVLVTADANGQVRVRTFTLKKDGRIVAGRSNRTDEAAERGGSDDMPADKAAAFSLTMADVAAFELSEVPSACGWSYSRNSGHMLLIGDKSGTLRTFTRNGTALTATSLSQKPVTAIARGGQFLAAASDASIHLFSLPTMKPLKYQCRGIQAGVRTLEFDSGAPMFLYAGTEAGTLAVFNVRSKHELFPCELVDTAAIGDQPVESVATTRGYVLASAGCTVHVFNSTTAKHRSLTSVESVDLRTEGCSTSDRVAVSGSFVQGVRPSEVTFLVSATPQRVIVFDSKLEYGTESTFNITSLRLPVLAIAALLVFAFQYFKRPKTSRLAGMDGYDAFSRMANRQRRAGRRAAADGADGALSDDDEGEAFSSSVLHRSNRRSELHNRIDRLGSGLSPPIDS